MINKILGKQFYPVNRDVLIDTSWQDGIWNYAGTPESDSITSNVQKDVIRFNFGIAQSNGMVVCDEGEPVVVKSTIKDMLAPNESMTNAAFEINF